MGGDNVTFQWWRRGRRTQVQTWLQPGGKNELKTTYFKTKPEKIKKYKHEKTKSKCLITGTNRDQELGVARGRITVRILANAVPKQQETKYCGESDWWMAAAEAEWTHVKGVELMTRLERDWGSDWGNDRTQTRNRMKTSIKKTHQNNTEHDT